MQLRQANNKGWNPTTEPFTLSLGGKKQPSQRFVKDVIRAGDYVKQGKTEDDSLQFSVSKATLDHWVEEFQRMRENGVKVPIPNGHDAAGKSTENLGWVDDLFVEGDTLFMSCTLSGEKALEAAANSDVSINSPPELTDGKGNTYVRPIDHVAMVTDPVVPGLGDFIPLAASRRLAKQQENTMDFLMKLAEMFGMDPASLGDDQAAAEAMMLKAIGEKMAAKKEEPAVSASMDDDAAPAVDPMQAGGEKGKVKNVSVTYAASRSGQVDGVKPMMVDSVFDGRNAQIEGLVAKAKITPAQADMLKKQWCDKDAITLSLSRNETNDAFNSALAVLDANAAAVDTGSKTGPQAAIELSRYKTEENANPLVEDAKRRAEAAKAK